MSNNISRETALRVGGGLSMVMRNKCGQKQRELPQHTSCAVTAHKKLERHPRKELNLK